MILTLKGQLTTVQESGRQTVQKKSEFEDIIIALADMGYERKRAAEAVENAAQSMRSSGINPSEKEDELFRSAIVHLSSS